MPLPKKLTVKKYNDTQWRVIDSQKDVICYRVVKTGNALNMYTALHKQSGAWQSIEDVEIPAYSLIYSLEHTITASEEEVS